VPFWGQQRQKEFEDQVAKLVVAANLPLSVVDNLEFDKLRSKFIPGPKGVSRKVLSGRTIPGLNKAYRRKAIDEVRGNSATLQGDGWTSVNHHHFVAWMITTNGKVPSSIY
jgi:hypothetical protein